MTPAAASAERPRSVVVVGSYNQDYAWHIDVAPQAGETRRGDSFFSAPGGKGFNQAVACARQGVATAFVGAIGADAAGNGARELAQAEGIDAHWLVRDDAATGSACIVVEGSGQNRIIVALGANERLDPAHLRAQSGMFARTRVLLAQLENNIEATRAAFELASTHGLIRILNPAPVHARLDAALLALVDVLTPNETEFSLLLARIAGDTLDACAVATLDDARLHAYCRRLGVATVIVTLGAAGCFVSHAADGAMGGDATAYYRIAAERVQTIDTTGAGDAFNGALVAALAMAPERPLRAAVVQANRVAALSTERVGAAVAMPDAAAVRTRFGGD